MNELLQFNHNDIFLSLRGVFFVLLIFSASYLAPYIGCNFQNILAKNNYFKHGLLFFMIFFTINLVYPQKKKMSNPLIILFKSCFVYILFVFLNILPQNSILLIMILFALLLLSTNYYYYYHDVVVDKKKYKYIEDIIKACQYGLAFSIFTVIVIGLTQNKKQIFKLTKCCK